MKQEVFSVHDMVNVKPNPFVSILMINFNGKVDLAKCLPSLFNTKYAGFEVIILDNGSSDGSAEMLREFSNFGNRIKTIFSLKNLGFAEANNIAYKTAEGDFIVALNCDTIVSPLWLEELVKTITEDQETGIVQSKLLSLKNPQLIDSAGDLVHPSGCSIPRGMGEKDRGQYDQEPEIFSARGAAIITRRSIIEQIGFFDPDYFMYYEDVDFSWRVRLAGYKVKLAPKSIVYHRGFDSYDETYKTKMHCTYENRYVTLIKNYEFRNLLRHMPQLVIITFLKIFSFFTIPEVGASAPLSFRLDVVTSLLEAPFHVIKNFRAIWMKRLQVQLRRKIPDKVLMTAMSRMPLTTFIVDVSAANQRRFMKFDSKRKSSTNVSDECFDIA